MPADLTSLGQTATELFSLPKTYYPLFDWCHILLCVLTVRKEAGKPFAHKHPFACWVSCIVSSFAGSILANPWMGKPMFGAFSDEKLFVTASVIYLAVFFSPGDVFYSLVNIKPLYVVICILKEIYRAKKIFGGLQDGSKAFPTSPYLIPVIVAVVKGNGSAFMAPFARAIRGDWRPQVSEFMKPSVTTKECVLAAILLAMYGAKDVLYLSFVGLFLSVKLGSLFGSPVDPFGPIEAALFAIVDGISSPGEQKTKEQ